MIDIKLHEALHQQFFLICTKSKYYLGVKEWWLNGELHRADGPAMTFANEHKVWYYHGKWIDCRDNQEFLRMIKLIAFL